MFTKRDYFHLLFLFACAAVLLSPVLFSGRSFFLRDLTSLFHPWRALAAEMVQEGRMPLWDPYAYCGMPFLANWQSAILYPFSLLFYLFPFAAALKAYGVLHLFLAGLFAYLFGRKTGLNRPGALGLALVFSFNGYLITRSEFLSHFGVDVWTFALLLFIDAPVLLALALTLAFLAGHQVFLLLIVIVLAYRLADRAGRPWHASLAILAVAFAYAAALSAVQLLPTAELAGFSARVKAGVGSVVALTNSLQFSDLARFVSPLFPSSIAGIAGERLPWPTTYHVGFIASGAALLALLRGPFPRRKVLGAGLVAAGLLFALGPRTPVYPWLLDHFFVLRFMRYPAQYLLFTVTGAALLAGAGFHSIRFRYAAVALCAVELIAAGFAFQATAPDGYFTERPQTVDLLRNDAAHGRFILSPGTETDRRIRTAGVADAWQTARSYLYGLTCLPYHLKNAYGTGEPLVPAPVEDLVNDAYEKRDPQSALPCFDSMGVRDLLSRSPLPDETGYRRIAPPPFAVYRLGTPAGMLVLSGGGKDAAGITGDSPGRTSFVVHSSGERTVTWKETTYPGWELYVNGKRTPYDAGGDVFRRWRTGPGESRIVELYRPLSFRFGLAITLATIVFLAFFGIIKGINPYVRNQRHIKP